MIEIYKISQWIEWIKECSLPFMQHQNQGHTQKLSVEFGQTKQPFKTILGVKAVLDLDLKIYSKFKSSFIHEASWASHYISV